MNKLPLAKQEQIVRAIVDGCGVRATARIVGVSKNTVNKLGLDLGLACWGFQDVALRDLPCNRIECDEIWSFVGSKEKNVPAQLQGEPGRGDVWTWVGIDAETKLVATWLVGKRTPEDAHLFIHDLAERLANRVQLTTDGLKMYLTAVRSAFGSEIDYAMLIKLYGNESAGAGRYSPAKCTGIEKKAKIGDPDEAHVSTSYVERQNLTMRMGSRRFTRLTNAFSKKLHYHMAAVALHYMYYNFARPHQTLTKAAKYPTTPAMAAGLTDHVWTIGEMLALLKPDAEATA